MRGINSQIPLHSVLYYIHCVMAWLRMRIVGVKTVKMWFFVKQGRFWVNSPQRAQGEQSWRAGFFRLMNLALASNNSPGERIWSGPKFSPWRASLRCSELTQNMTCNNSPWRVTTRQASLTEQQLFYFLKIYSNTRFRSSSKLNTLAVTQVYNVIQYVNHR